MQPAGNPNDRFALLAFLAFLLTLLAIGTKAVHGQPLRAGYQLASLAVPLPKQLDRAAQARNAVATIAWLQARLAIREATGRNDGPAVAALVRAGGGVASQHPEWCGFTQAACQRAHGLPIPARGMQGAARAWFQDAHRTYYLAGQRGALDSIKPGHQAGFNYGRGIHHITRFVEVVPPLRKGRPPRGFYTIGGNEGRGLNAGVHRTYYPSQNIAAASNWLY